MEVLGTNNTMKESETQNSESNYNCRLPRDLNLGSNSRSQGETDVGLLVACKIQLSSEVIRWKTETLRLQKERDSAQSRAKDLDQKVSKLDERTKELEDRLLQAEEENKHLKSRGSVIDEEKAALVQKLSQSVNKYHSYPWGDTSPKSPRVSRLQMSDVRRSEVLPNEDWREVSQKMLQKMKQEMRELQEMSIRFSSEDKGIPTESPKETDCKDEVQEGISSLLSETESLKHHLLEQRQKLQSLLVGLTSGESIQAEYSNIPNKIKYLDSSSVDIQCPAAKNKSSHSRPHNNKSPVYLTKQLETLDDLNKVSKEMRPSSRNQETNTASQEGPGGLKQNSKLKNPIHVQKSVEDVRDEKVCPICQMNFNAAVSQGQFEDHVLNHLETESTSLLDQYVVL